jgi:hypothetical protein
LRAGAFVEVENSRLEVVTSYLFDIDQNKSSSYSITNRHMEYRMPSDGPLPEQVLIFIDVYRQREGAPPSLSAIAAAFKIDVAGAKACVDELIELGFLRRFGGHAESGEAHAKAS